MVKIALLITCMLDNIEELRPSGPDFRWCLKFTCGNCQYQSRTWNYVSLDRFTPIERGHGVHHYVSKCKCCDRQNSVSIIEDSVKPFISKLQDEYTPIVTFDCRGIEPYSFSAREGWTAKAAQGGKEFTDVDLSEEEWEDYCDIIKQPVGIYDIKYKFERVK